MDQAVSERYATFARDSAAGRSAVYEEWALGVAADTETQDILARIPETHRQPPLVFAVTRMLGAPVAEFGAWRAFVREHADAVVEECSQRSIQTNEPLRTAALLPLLSEIDGPIALLEVGASAGLCLYPDRYSYRFETSEGPVALDPVDGVSEVVLHATVSGAVPSLRLPEIVWRAGIDLEPRDARDAEDRAWLRGLVWPGEEGREARISAALDIAAADSPLLVRGDAAAELTALAARAPAEATLVISTPGVLVHIPYLARIALVDQIRALNARWITIDPPGIFDLWVPPIEKDTWRGFVLALDGEVRGAADPLGAWWEWHPRNADSRA